MGSLIPNESKNNNMPEIWRSRLEPQTYTAENANSANISSWFSSTRSDDWKKLCQLVIENADKIFKDLCADDNWKEIFMTDAYKFKMQKNKIVQQELLKLGNRTRDISRTCRMKAVMTAEWGPGHVGYFCYQMYQRHRNWGY